MAEVFIDSLTLENFGPYYGEHTFNFATLEDTFGLRPCLPRRWERRNLGR